MLKNTGMLFVFAAFLICGCSEDENGLPYQPSEPDTLSVSFRDGSQPYPAYFGTRDAVIKDGPGISIRCANFGSVEADTAGLVELPEGLFERRLVIRFDLSLITSCQQVIEARLSLSVDPSPGDTVTFFAYRVNAPAELPDSWVEGDGHGEWNPVTGVCWDYASETSQWSRPGGDYYTPRLTAQSAAEDSVLTFGLPPALIEEWIGTPGANDGIIIMTPETTEEKSRVIYSRENPRLDLRPLLFIKYIGGG